MKKALLHFVLLAVLFVGVAQWIEQPLFIERPHVENTGRHLSPIEKLQSASYFAIGPVSDAGRTSANELALRSVLTNTNATIVLTQLLTNSTPEGKLYAACGLRMVSPEILEAAETKIDKKSRVHFFEGCFVSIEQTSDILQRIIRGDYDASLKQEPF